MICRPFFGVLCLLAFVTSTSAQQTTKEKSVLNHAVKTIEGEQVTLDKYGDNVLLIVNVASECGLTPQYKKLQALHEQYADKGLRILGFPCNQFGGQEPGTPEQIKAFCESTYQVTFDLFDKIDVNGKEADELYQQLTSLELEPEGSGAIKWNFEKFLIGRNGQPVARFSPRIKPDAPELIDALERELAKSASAAQ